MKETFPVPVDYVHDNHDLFEERLELVCLMVWFLLIGRWPGKFGLDVRTESAMGCNQKGNVSRCRE